MTAPALTAPTTSGHEESGSPSPEPTYSGRTGSLLHEKLWAWAQNLPDWQSDLLRRVLVGQVGGEYDAVILRSLWSAAGGATSNATCVRVQESDLPTQAAPSAIRLTALYDVEDVGRVERQQKFAFGTSGLTLVYGDNGAGKSTYARILKSACRARGTAARVLPNAYEPPRPATPRAKVEFVKAGVSTTVEWTNTGVQHTDLKSVSVFDGDVARNYIDERGKVAYQPVELGVMTQLAAEQDRLSRLLAERAEEHRRARPQFHELPVGSRARTFTEGISASTDLSQFDVLTRLRPDVEDHRQALTRRLEELKQRDPAALAKEKRERAGKLRQSASWIEKRAPAVDDEAADRMMVLRKRLSFADDAVAEWTKKTSQSRSHLGIGTPLGTAMRDAGVAFAEAHHIAHRHSEVDATCPLCLQPLGPEARERSKAFEEFATGALETARRGARTELEQARESHRAFSRKSVEGSDLLRPLLSDAPAVLRAVEALLRAMAARAERLADGQADVAALPPLPTPATAAATLRAHADELDSEAAALEKDAGGTTAEKVRAELVDLSSRAALGRRREDVEKTILIEKQLARIQKAQGLLRTQAITARRTEWADAVVTDDLRRAISSELQALHLDGIPVRIDSKGKKGDTEVALALSGQQLGRPGEILSEGEQRALALAFFLAEVQAGAGDAPIVVDDPVSSLDHERREHVAKRLAEAARTRQVIVFTHDIFFAFVLKKEVSARAVAVTDLRVHRFRNLVGSVAEGVPWRAEDVHKRFKHLRDELKKLTAVEAKATDEEALRPSVEYWCKRLRETWERAVEEVVFGGVVYRFAPDIQTQRLKTVRVDEHLRQTVIDGMSWASNYVHDEAPAKNTPLPTCAELAVQLARLESVLQASKK